MLSPGACWLVSLGVNSTGVGKGGGEEAEQVLAVKDDYIVVTTIDAQATGTGALAPKQSQPQKWVESGSHALH